MRNRGGSLMLASHGYMDFGRNIIEFRLIWYLNG